VWRKTIASALVAMAGTALGTTAAFAAGAPAAAPITSDPTFWHIARAAGLTAYVLLTVQVVLGLSVKTVFLDGILARWQSLDLHKFTALLGLGFLALHVLALLGDQYMHFTPAQLLIPFASTYRPVYTAAGVIALYLFVALVASFYVRDLIGYNAWRALHYAAFAAWLLALTHGILTGTDAAQLFVRVLYWGTGSLVAMLIVWRFLDPDSRPQVRSATAHVANRIPLPQGKGELSANSQR
jgi:methionine sulfoxide reductase heme-binding subunit